jgi:hypothetical protein
LYELQFFGSDVWAAGKNGTIVRTSTASSFSAVAKYHSSLFEVSPSGFHLYQNYPNPFNPVTNFKFRIPVIPPSEGGQRGMLVTMKIYNLLGQEVATLIDREEYESGDYEIGFDASTLSSGVYLYRINVVGQDCILSYIDVKRMTLVK